ncbi:MAG: glycosyl hydrolase family 28-related protein [Sphingomonadaceae bacterium]
MTDGMAQLRAGGQVYELEIPVNDPEGDAAARINDALNRGSLSGGGSLLLPVGTLWCRQSILMPSNSELVIPTGCTLMLAAGANCNVVANADPTNGNAGIRITGGGTIDGNRASQSSGGNGINLSKCDDARLAVTIQNCYTDGLALSTCKRPVLDVVASSNGRHGVYLAGSTFASGMVTAINNGQRVAGNGVTLDAVTTDATLTVAATDTQGAKTQQYGVVEVAASGCDRNLISGSLNGNAAGTASLVGAASKLLDNLSGLPLSGYAAAALPAAGTAGRLARVTDTTRGVWMDTGYQWVSLSGQTVNAREFGAKGDGVTDDTAALQAALNAAAGSTLLLPPGTYIIDPAVGLTVASNSRVVFAPGAKLQNKAHNLGSYQMLRVWDSQNVVIEGATLDGRRDLNAATTGEWGMGISICGSTRVRVVRPSCSNCWGDGIYIDASATGGQSWSDDVSIIDAVCDNNRRQGISVCSARRLWIVRPRLTNTNGTNPQAGIDLEPYSTAHYLEDIWIEEPYTAFNAGAGILVYPNALGGSGHTVSIQIRGHVNVLGQGAPVQLTGGMITLPGSIVISEPMWIQARYAAFYATWGINAPRVIVDKPVVVDPNQANSSAPNLASAFCIVAESTDTGTDPLGNVSIFEPTVVGPSGSLPPQAVFVNDYRTGAQDKPSKVAVMDPIAMQVMAGQNPVWLAAKQATFTDRYRILVLEPPAANSSIGPAAYYRTITNRNYVNAATITLESTFPVGIEITFEILAAQTLTIAPDAGSTIRPLGTGAGKYIQSNQIGASVTLRRQDTATWVVTNVVGSWTAQP